jgi:hypothetical protein
MLHRIANRVRKVFLFMVYSLEGQGRAVGVSEPTS